MTAIDERIHDMRADETGAACDQNVLQFNYPLELNLCGPLRTFAFSALMSCFKRRERKGTQRAAEESQN